MVEQHTNLTFEVAGQVKQLQMQNPNSLYHVLHLKWLEMKQYVDLHIRRFNLSPLKWGLHWSNRVSVCSGENERGEKRKKLQLLKRNRTRVGRWISMSFPLMLYCWAIAPSINHSHGSGIQPHTFDSRLAHGSIIDRSDQNARNFEIIVKTQTTQVATA